MNVSSAKDQPRHTTSCKAFKEEAKIWIAAGAKHLIVDAVRVDPMIFFSMRRCNACSHHVALTL